MTGKLVSSPELVMLYITACCKELILSCHPLLMQACKKSTLKQRTRNKSVFLLKGKKLFYTKHAARWFQFHLRGYSVEAYCM